MLAEVEISSGVVRVGPLKNLHLNVKEVREPAMEISGKIAKRIVNENSPSQV